MFLQDAAHCVRLSVHLLSDATRKFVIIVSIGTKFFRPLYYSGV